MEDQSEECLERAEGEEVVEGQEEKEDGSHHLVHENHQGVLEQCTPVHLILDLGMTFTRKEEKLILEPNLVTTEYQHPR